MAKTLVAWFSHAGENYVDGSIAPLEHGNCEQLAHAIAKGIGADEFRIQEADPYPYDYQECIARAKDEQTSDARPALVQAPPEIASYDAVVLVYPNWWGDMPMPVRTFLDGVDLSGKALAPLCSNEGSGMGRSERTLRRLFPQADIKPGLALPGHRTQESLGKAVDWARRQVG
jgi:flavodoxin